MCGNVRASIMRAIVPTLEIDTATSYPSVTLPNTGCFDGPGENPVRGRGRR